MTAGSSSSLKTIVVGVDGSPESAAALDWAIGLARRLQAEIVAVYALYLPVFAGSGYEAYLPVDEQWRAEQEKTFVRDWCAPLRSSGVSYGTIFRDGRPAAVIAEVADSYEADLIVVGRRGRSQVAELLLGSVSHELTHHCRRPVLVVSQGSGAAAQARVEVAARA